jgi:hypothetical protein
MKNPLVFVLVYLPAFIQSTALGPLMRNSEGHVERLFPDTKRIQN